MSTLDPVQKTDALKAVLQRAHGVIGSLTPQKPIDELRQSFIQFKQLDAKLADLRKLHGLDNERWSYVEDRQRAVANSEFGRRTENQSRPIEDVVRHAESIIEHAERNTVAPVIAKITRLCAELETKHARDHSLAAVFVEAIYSVPRPEVRVPVLNMLLKIGEVCPKTHELLAAVVSEDLGMVKISQRTVARARLIECKKNLVGNHRSSAETIEAGVPQIVAGLFHSNLRTRLGCAAALVQVIKALDTLKDTPLEADRAPTVVKDVMLYWDEELNRKIYQFHRTDKAQNITISREGLIEWLSKAVTVELARGEISFVLSSEIEGDWKGYVRTGELTKPEDILKNIASMTWLASSESARELLYQALYEVSKEATLEYVRNFNSGALVKEYRALGKKILPPLSGTAIARIRCAEPGKIEIERPYWVAPTELFNEDLANSY